jgi:protein-disulfide isomerase
MFEDLECPACARAHPLVVEVAQKHHTPLLLRDFPLLIHPWSFEAAVYARFFATKSETLSLDYRTYIFQNQTLIAPPDLRQYTEKFAAVHDERLPSLRELPDSLGRAVQADFDLGKRIGIKHTPTVFVVTAEGATSPLEVSDPKELSAVIEDLQAKYLPADSRAAVPTAKVRSRPQDHEAHPRK